MGHILPVFRKKIQNHSLKWKFFTIIAVSTVLMILFFFLATLIYSRASNDLLYKTVASNMSFSSYTVSSNLKDAERVADMLLANASVQEALISAAESDDIYISANSTNKINTELRACYETFHKSGISYISILGSRFTASTNYQAIKNESSDLLERAIASAEDADGAIVWTLDISDGPKLLVSRLIKQIENMDFTHLGYLVIGIDLHQLLQKISLPFRLFDESEYLLLSDNLPIFSSSTFPEEDIAILEDLPADEYSILTIRGESFLTVKIHLSQYSWDYVSLVPYSRILKSMHKTLLNVSLLILSGFVLTLLLSRKIISSVLVHFQTLLYKMDILSENDFVPDSSAYDYSGRNDEIGKLHQKFDRMAERLNYLVNTNLKNQLLAKEAKVKALESQINPHFLYNALETINWKAKALHDSEISEIAESLGFLLRENLNNYNSLVPLEHELQLAKSYITIQQIRFGERLVYSVNVDPSLLNLGVPAMAIQPLLENAVRYGVEENIDPCHIVVNVSHEGNEAVIRVSNEWSFFEPDLLQKLRNQEIKANGFGIGLINIDERIKLIYGEQYGLTLENTGDTATAIIHIPMNKGIETDETASC